MTVTAPATSSLDSRREKSTAADTAAEKAQAGVTELDQRLKANADLVQQQTQALKNAEAETIRLKRVLKNADKERTKLTRDRRKAVAKAEKAKARAQAAEARYDKVLLGELVRREKDRLRGSTASSAPCKEIEPAPELAPVAVASRRRTARAAADPAPEQPDPATATATRTAARRTAANAGVRTPRGRR